jgi:hypothetical protein
MQYSRLRVSSACLGCAPVPGICRILEPRSLGHSAYSILTFGGNSHPWLRSCCSVTGSARTPSDKAPMADAHWRRPRSTSWAPPALPKCFKWPSQHASPPQISRRECARPTWQNNMAMNWPQLVKPRACRSALCCLTAFSNPPRENNFNTCEKMLYLSAFYPTPGEALASGVVGKPYLESLGLLPACPSSNRNPNPVISVDDRSRLIASVDYCSFANSALACLKMGRSGSAFFQFANRVS